MQACELTLGEVSDLREVGLSKSSLDKDDDCFGLNRLHNYVPLFMPLCADFRLSDGPHARQCVDQG